MTLKRSLVPILTLVLIANLSCVQRREERNAQQQDVAVPARVVETIARKITEYAELPGRSAAAESVEVRAQVSGYLESINFAAGSFVHKGDPLFTLDSRVYRAVLAQRQSDVDAKRADLNRLEAELKRQQGLIEKSATSMQQLELAQAERDERAAELEAAIANVERAKIDLDYTTIESPIDGEVSRERITVGNLVTVGSTLLTHIVAVDPIHVFFDVDERALLLYRERVAKENGASKGSLVVKFAIGDGEFDHEATVDFAEPKMNETTGTLEFRAVAENKPNEVGVRNLIPGLRLRVLFPTSPEYDAVLVPEEAIITDQNVKRVYVLGENNIVESRAVTLGPLQSDNMRVVATGLKLGERVVLDNLLRIRPNTVVEPIPVPSESTTRIVREDGVIINRDGTVEYDGLYEWSLERDANKKGAASEAAGKNPA